MDFVWGAPGVRTLPRVGCTGRCVRAVCLTSFPQGLLKDAAPSFRGDSSARLPYVQHGCMCGLGTGAESWAGAEVGRSPLEAPRGLTQQQAPLAGRQQAEWGGGGGYCRDCLEQRGWQVMKRATRGYLGSVCW